MASGRGAEHAANIMGALQEATRPLSAYDLLEKLRPTGVGAPLTIYRALEKLIAAGKVHRVETLNAFVACRHGEHHGHEPAAEAAPRAVGFAICDACGAVEEFIDGRLFDDLAGALARTGFRPRASTVEVRGRCARCAQGGTDAAAGRSP